MPENRGGGGHPQYRFHCLLFPKLNQTSIVNQSSTNSSGTEYIYTLTNNIYRKKIPSKRGGPRQKEMEGARYILALEKKNREAEEYRV